MSEDIDMDTRTRRPARTAATFGVGIALLAATGVAAATPVVSSLAAQPTAARPAAVTAPAAIHGTAVSAPKPSLLPPQGAAAGVDCTDASSDGSGGCTIHARTGTVSVAGVTNPLQLWKFSADNTEAGAGSALIVGRVGVKMTIHLVNDLAAPVGLSIPQLDGVGHGLQEVDGNGAYTAAAAPGGGTQAFTFTPDRAGTYVYQAGLTDAANPGTSVDGVREVAMGLVGALVVRPAAGSADAYDVAESTFDDEAVLVYTDVDTHMLGNPGTFNMRDWTPNVHLINGHSYPDTPPIATALHRTTMLRFVNGSLLEKSPTILGTRMTQVARSGRPVPAPLSVSGRFMNTGDTFDATVFANTEERFAIFDSPGVLRNDLRLTAGSPNAPRVGGAVTFLDSTGAAATRIYGPTVSSFTAAGQPGGPSRPITLSATFTGSGSSNVQGADMFVDDLGALPTPVTFTPGNPVTVTWPLAGTILDGLASGEHTIWVTAYDGSAYGARASVKVRVDRDGPAVSGVTLSRNHVNGTQDVDLGATLDERNTGGSQSVAARYWIDGSATDPTGAPVSGTMDTNGPRSVAAATGTIAKADIAGLAEGTHSVRVQGQDDLGQWGAVTSKDIVVDTTAPVTTAITLKPVATNGLVGSPNKPGNVTITATVADAASAVTGVEGFLDSVGPAGSANGLYFSPLGGGKWQTDMPLAWLAGKKADGLVSLYVVGTDAAGNRSDGTGATESTTINLDRTKPTVSLDSLVQGTGYLANRTLTVGFTAADNATATGSGIVYAEWFVGADPGQGRATALAVPSSPNVGPFSGSFTYDLYAAGLFNGGNVTVTVRAKDAAGNWVQARSTVVTTSLWLFRNGFESSQLADWNLGSTGAVTTTTQTSQGRISGGRSLRVAVRPAAYYSVDLSVPTYANQPLSSFHATFDMRSLTAVTRCATSGSTATCRPGGVTVFQAVGPNGTVVVVQYGRAAANRAARFRVGIRSGSTTAFNGGFSQGWATVGSATTQSFNVVVDWSSSGRRATAHVNGGGAINSPLGSSGQTVTSFSVGSVNLAPLGSTGNLSFDNVNIA